MSNYALFIYINSLIIKKLINYNLIAHIEQTEAQVCKHIKRAQMFMLTAIVISVFFRLIIILKIIFPIILKIIINDTGKTVQNLIYKYYHICESTIIIPIVLHLLPFATQSSTKDH